MTAVLLNGTCSELYCVGKDQDFEKTDESKTTFYKTSKVQVVSQTNEKLMMGLLALGERRCYL